MLKKFLQWIKTNRVVLAVFVTVIFIFSALIFYGGFHHADDFHFFRGYSLKELLQVWYSNWDLDNMESDGYRPIAIWIYRLLFTLFGFNRDFSEPYMAVIVLLNGLFAVAVFRLARHWLSDFYAFLAAVITVVIPQTLLHFTWATEIPATVCFILTLVSFDLLMKWVEKPKDSKLLIEVILLGLLASLVKETGYSVLAAIPVAALFILPKISKVKGSVLKKYLPYYLPLVLVTVLVIIRHLALLVFPEMIAANAPRVDFRPNLSSISSLISSITFEFSLFFSYFISLINGLIFGKDFSPTELSNQSFGLSFLLVAIAFVINHFFWKNKFCYAVIIAHATTLLIAFFLNNVFIFALFYQYIYVFKLLVLGFTLYKYVTYVTAAVVAYYFVTRPFKKYFYLIAFYLVVMVPIAFGAFNRLKPVPNALLVIFTFCVIQFLIKASQKVLRTLGYGLLSLCLLIGAIYVLNAFKFIITDNYILSYGDLSKLEHDKFRPRVSKEIFMPNSKELERPLDCSKAFGGKPQFSVETTQAEGGTILLSSSNHLGCLTFPASPFRPRTNYQITFYAKTIKGNSEADMNFLHVIPESVRKKVIRSADGWNKFVVWFIPYDRTVYFTVYANGIEGKKSTVAYKNFTFKGGGMISYLQYEYEWPKIFSSQDLAVPLN